MQFDSLEFILFFTIVFFTISIFEWKKIGMILIFSILFYAISTNWLIVLSLLISILGNYFISLSFSTKYKPQFYYIAWIWNIGYIALFKYILKNSFEEHNYVIPLGLSYYTLQSLSYCIDVYNGVVKPERNLIRFATYISFFPQLTIGPIERGNQLLPQIKNWRKFNYQQVVSGFRIVLIGYFLKIVLASRLSEITTPVFNDFNSFNLLICTSTVVMYAFQLYFDFCGYSYIAIGCAKILGINMTDNFRFPFFSKTIGEFWRRWHISVSQWFRDYIFTPLFKSLKHTKLNNPNLRYLVSITVTFVLLGLWHYFSINFLIVGLIQAVFLTFEHLTDLKSKIPIVVGQIYTFSVFCFTVLFFKISEFAIIKKYFFRFFSMDFEGSSLDQINLGTLDSFLITLCLIICFFIVEYIQFKNNAIDFFSLLSPTVRWVSYILVIFLIFIFGIFNDTSEFIYKQF